MPTSDSVHPVDLHVGRQIATARLQRKITQGELGARIGVSFQQIQKYEKGKNRVSASVMYQMMKVMDLPSSYFLESFDNHLAGGMGAPIKEGLPANIHSFIYSRVGQAFLASLVEAPRRVRSTLIGLVLDIAGAGDLDGSE